MPSFLVFNALSLLDRVDGAIAAARPRVAAAVAALSAHGECPDVGARTRDAQHNVQCRLEEQQNLGADADLAEYGKILFYLFIVWICACFCVLCMHVRSLCMGCVRTMHNGKYC